MSRDQQRRQVRSELMADLRRCAARIDRIHRQAEQDKAAALRAGRPRLAAQIEADAKTAIKTEQRTATEIEKDIRDFG